MNVEISRVSFGYDQSSLVLRDITFNACDGQIVSILGPSGSGKSTLLRLISGALPAGSSSRFSGTVTYDGQRSHEPLRSTGQIGFMFQTPSLLPCYTVEENIRLPLKLARRSKAVDSTDQLVSKVGLERYKRSLPSQLSGGMQTRVALARTLVTGPSLLLLDEPFSSLDFGWRLRLYDLFTSLHHGDPSRTSILVTHDIAEAFLLAGTVLVLSTSGRLIDRFTPSQPKIRSFTPEVIGTYLERLRFDMLTAQQLLFSEGRATCVQGHAN